MLGRHYSDTLYRLPSGLKSRIYVALEQIANHRASRIVVPSTFVRDLLVQRQRIGSEQIDVIHYGFQPKKYLVDSGDIAELRQDLGLTGAYTLATFGHLHPEKGHRFLLRAPRYARR